MSEQFEPHLPEQKEIPYADLPEQEINRLHLATFGELPLGMPRDKDIKIAHLQDPDKAKQEIAAMEVKALETLLDDQKNRPTR